MKAHQITAVELGSIDFGKIEEIDLSNFVSSIDLRPTVASMGLEVRNQNGRGTCSVFASTFLLEYMTAMERGLIGLDLSEEYLNAATNRATGDKVDGDFFDNIGKGYSAFGVVNEVWLRYLSTFDETLVLDDELIRIGEASRLFSSDFMYAKNVPHSSDCGLNSMQLAAILKHLNNSVPVAIGIHGRNDIEMIQVGGLEVWNEMDGEAQWGHSVALVGYRSGIGVPSGGYFIFRNSYGSRWGDRGYGYLSFNYVKKHACDAVVYGRSPQFLPQIHVVPPPPKRVRFPVPPIVVMDKLGKLINPISRIDQISLRSVQFR